MGKSTINGPFSIAMLNFEKVDGAAETALLQSSAFAALLGWFWNILNKLQLAVSSPRVIIFHQFITSCVTLALLGKLPWSRSIMFSSYLKFWFVFLGIIEIYWDAKRDQADEVRALWGRLCETVRLRRAPSVDILIASCPRGGWRIISWRKMSHVLSNHTEWTRNDCPLEVGHVAEVHRKAWQHLESFSRSFWEGFSVYANHCKPFCHDATSSHSVDTSSATRLASYWCWWVFLDCLASGPWSRRAFASVAHGCRCRELWVSKLWVSSCADDFCGYSQLMWVCLKIGYTPNYSHLVGIMIINHWV